MTRAATHSADTVAVRWTHRRGVVLAVSLLAMVVAATTVWLLTRVVPELPVRQVRFSNSAGGTLQRVDANDLERVASAVAVSHFNLLRADLGNVKAAVEQVAWVRQADVRRQLPDRIEVRIEEHEVLARWRPLESRAPAARASDEGAEAEELAVDEWREDWLVSPRAEVFRAPISTSQQAALPLLGGPEGAAPEVLAALAEFKRVLTPVQRTPRELLLSGRRAWTLRLDNGSVLELGRSDAVARLQRFVQAYTQVAQLQAPGLHVDARYGSGLALRQVAQPTNTRTVATKPANRPARPRAANT